MVKYIDYLSGGISMKEDNVAKKSHAGVIICCVLTGILGIAGGLIGGYFIGSPSSEDQKILDEYHLLKEDWLYGNEVEYISDYASSGLVNGIAGSVKDPYTFYTKNYEDQGLSTDGTGFGFSSHSYDGGLYVSTVHTGPSEGKLYIGDILYAVKRGNEEKYDFKSHTSTEIHNYLGQNSTAGTSYVFSLLRNGTETDVTLQKGIYSEKASEVLEEPTDLNNNTMTIRVNTFLGSPSIDVKTKIQTRLTQGKTIRKLVIDLRQNGGGYVSEAMNLAKLFVKKGTLIYQLVNKDGKVIESGSQTGDPYFSIDDYSIITDSGTASASEIFTLAMRAGANTKVVGFKSYGKGIAQQFKTFSDGSVIRYTSAYVYGPEKENETMYEEGKDDDKVMCIHGKGIVPDVVYSTDYQFLQSAAAFYSNISVSESGMNYMLKFMNFVYKNDIDRTYSSTYQFGDAIKEFSAFTAIEYSDNSYLTAFDSEGKVSKNLNDKLVKKSYDEYLVYYGKLTKEASLSD